MRNLITYFLLVLAFGSSCAWGAPRSSVNNVTERFFDVLLQEHDIGLAYDYLFEGSEIEAEQPSQVEVMKKQTKAAFDILGEYRQRKLIIEKVADGYAAQVVYLMRFGDGVLVWEFIFFYENDGWVIANVRFDDEIESVRAVLFSLDSDIQ